MIGFDPNECNSIKSIAIEKDMQVDVTTRLIKGKMLMFSKLSLKSFTYHFIDTFCFPTEEIQEIYDQYSTFNIFMFVCEIDYSIKESGKR